MLITPAFAQGAGVPSGNDMVMQLLPFAMVLIIMYFLLIRPQQRRAKVHAEMIKNLRRGDVVELASGFVGKISKIIEEANEVEVEIADNVRVRVLRHAVAGLRSKTEPAG